MNEITVIKCETVGKGKIRVGFDTGLSCLLYRGEMKSLDICESGTIDAITYQRMIEEVLCKRTRRRAMHLLEQMDRTEAQLRDKLKAGEYPKECIDDAVMYVAKYHYIDDERYAANYVRNAQSKKSRRRIQQDLMKKGVVKETIEAALEEEYVSDEEDQIRELLTKKGFDYKTADEKEFRRTYSFLLRRGFKANDILRVMKYEEPYYLT